MKGEGRRRGWKMTGRGIKRRETWRETREEGGFFWKSDPRPRWLVRDLKLDLLLDRNRASLVFDWSAIRFVSLPFFLSFFSVSFFIESLKFRLLTILIRVAFSTPSLQQKNFVVLRGDNLRNC